MTDIKVKTKVYVDASAEEIFQAILESRGYKTTSEQEAFLNPSAPTLDLLLGQSGLKKTTLKKAKAILDSHLKSNHDICVFGDYDADGVTATAIMWQAVSAYAKVQESKSHVLPFIPDRHRHGYGLGDKAVAEVIGGEAFRTTQFQGFAPKLIVTVDTGIVAHVGIKSFVNAKIDVIVTDHHQPEEKLPPASCIVYTLATSGAGLAWIFSMYLLGSPAGKLLDLATIGVIADMMPLTGLNRSIIARGLDALSHTLRPGLLAMKKAMGIGEKDLSTYDISFGIAPRLNAAGRIYNPLDALRLMCTSDKNLATELAGKIESHNRDRQEYTDHALRLAASYTAAHKIIIVSGDYHEGVIGLVAGKLTEIYHRPAIVMSDNGEVVKGSARSVSGINITELLRSLKTPFLGLGGHEQAAGFNLARNKVTGFTKELKTLADREIKDTLLIKSESADLTLPLKSTSLKLAKMLSTLEPIGIGNPKPKFILYDLNVLEDRELGAGGKHHKLTVEQGGATRELLMFNTVHSHPLDHISTLICTLDVNVWRDRESLQLIGSYVEN
ncbi:MAG: DHH family phosphoesterase [bacterium]